MQDKALCHMAKLVVKWFEFCNVKLIPWPGSSLGVNPSERLWLIIKYKLQDRETSSILHLHDPIQRIWGTLTRKTYETKLITFLSIFRRLRRAEGTQYIIHFGDKPLSTPLIYLSLGTTSPTSVTVIRHCQHCISPLHSNS